MSPLVEFISKTASGTGPVAKFNAWTRSLGISFCISKAFTIRPVPVRAVMPAEPRLHQIARHQRKRRRCHEYGEDETPQQYTWQRVQERELARARQTGSPVVKLIHGYGSTGEGGEIRSAAQRSPSKSWSVGSNVSREFLGDSRRSLALRTMSRWSSTTRIPTMPFGICWRHHAHWRAGDSSRSLDVAAIAIEPNGR